MMNKLPKLSYYVEHYTKLRTWWEKAQRVIAEAARTSLGVEQYQLLPEDFNDEVRLRVCGALAYVRFTHDFKNGRLEYGALLVTADGRPVRRARIRGLGFDGMGSVGGQFHFDDQDEQSFRRLHLQTMAEIVPTIVEMYFSETDTETSK